MSPEHRAGAGNPAAPAQPASPAARLPATGSAAPPTLHQSELHRSWQPPVGTGQAGHAIRVPRCWLGHLRITANAAQCVPVAEILDAFARHAAGDWGLMDAHDRQQNDRALITRGRLVSLHTTRAGQAFWIITDPGWGGDDLVTAGGLLKPTSVVTRKNAHETGPTYPPPQCPRAAGPL